MGEFHVQFKGKQAPTLGPEREPYRLRSYFENHYGESWVFEYDFEKEEGTVWGGDFGWRPLRVVDVADALSLRDAEGDTCSLNTEEYTWLDACWLAAQAHRRVRDARREEGEAGTS